ncbi:hypothetical protein CANARDRAFT_200106 [[Candida] arabinofermentans NRRL YB-2248]|uniref:Phosphatidic acid phosphatase type 2/haloperoxidase domain-containing protein n=1 Tax=[Candida] arabinofermentans NRRL YB-2248 TaxID=983967 RepID=A0A1E4SZB8_9ASCO|nr:hypothetical protein CANARDRAFT_200106 [[Candida] arabinofermentans NRRL YB-2248]
MTPKLQELIPFDHTYILYDPENPLSLAIAIASLTPILILVFIFSWFVITREVESCLLAFGHVLNDLTSCIIKKLSKFERPIEGQIFKTDGSLAYGMPSSHSQFVSFLTCYMTLKMLLQWPTALSKKCQIVSIGSLLAVQFSVVYSRVYFSYHNFYQVFVGTILGIFLSSAYFLLVSILRDVGLINWLLDWNICQLLQMKDSFDGSKVTTLADERNNWKNKSTHYIRT